MAGTKEGAAKMKAKLLDRDPDYFKKLSSTGGKSGKGRTHSEETKRKISQTKRAQRDSN